MKPKALLLPAALMIAMGASLPAAAELDAAVHTQGNVAYRIGGVGLDERTIMEDGAGKFNVKLMFAEADGAFLLPQSFSIRHGATEVLNATEAGPIVYLSLPPGAYTVQANYNGVARSRTINVGRRTPDVVMTWPTSSDRRDLK